MMGVNPGSCELNLCFQYKLGACGIWGSHSGGYEEFYLLGYNAV
jgi:hypothetical protein